MKARKLKQLNQNPGKYWLGFMKVKETVPVSQQPFLSSHMPDQSPEQGRDVSA